MEEDIRKTVKDMAIENFKSGLNCAESVYDALIRSGALKVAPETRAMAIGFGGGMGLTGNACGALSAAILANGAKYGRPDPWTIDPEERGQQVSGKYYRRYNRLVHDFEKANNGVSCKDICKQFEDWHSRERRVMCMKMVGATAELAYDYLNISQEEALSFPMARTWED